MPNSTLFGAFPPVSDEAWLAKIEEDLKGKPFEHLCWPTDEGFTLHPYYRKADTSILGFRSMESWQIIQEIPIDDLKLAQMLIEEAQACEISVFRLYSRQGKVNLSHLEKLVHHSKSNISLDLPQTLFLAHDDFKRIKSLSVESIIYDPLAASVFGKQSLNDLSIQKIAQLYAEKGNRTKWGIDLRYVHESGGNVTQQLAFALAMVVEYMDQLSEHFDHRQVMNLFKKISINFAIGSNFFMELAKFRAFRRLFARLLEVMEVETFAPQLIAQTGLWNQTRYDVYNNLLRNTSAAMSAVLGGADAVLVSAFDKVSTTENLLSVRLARNIQHLLRAEAYLDHVKDVVAGAYYLEHITEALADASWKLFQQIEAEGGMRLAIESGTISSMLASSKQTQLEAVAKGEKAIIGINRSPNLQEVHFWKSEENEDNSRAAAHFEAVRSAIDAFGQKRNRRLTAFLLTFGDPGMRNARASFSRNLLGSGGIAIVENATPDDLTQSFVSIKELKPDIIVLCSSDADYLAQARQIFEAEDQALHILAGGMKGDWKVDAQLYAGMNVLELLTQLAHHFVNT